MSWKREGGEGKVAYFYEHFHFVQTPAEVDLQHQQNTSHHITNHYHSCAVVTTIS